MPAEAEEPRKITPFRIIQPGEDTIDQDDEIVFADFRARMEPADATDREIEVDPKDESAPVPAPLPDSMQQTVPLSSGTTAQPSADEESLQMSLFPSSDLASSSAPKAG